MQAFIRQMAGMGRPFDSARVRRAFLENCRRLMAGRAVQRHRVLERHQRTMILPSIALAQALRAEGLDTAELMECLAGFFRAYFSRTKRFYRLLGRLPGFFGLLRVALRASMKYRYPEAGWLRVWRQDSAHCMAFDMRSCFYQRMLHDQGELALLPLFCQIDDDLYSDLSGQVSWERTTTIARNGTHCDFRFARKGALRSGGQEIIG